jgi:hypothetical protein
MPDEATRLSRTGDVVRRQIADEIILVPVRRSAEDLDSIYAINPLAARVWDELDGQRTLGEIRDQILGEYEVSPEDVDRDLAEFIAQLKAEGLVREA